MGDSISQAGVYFSGDELTLMGGNVEQSQGAGITLDGGRQVSITGMYVDTNGQGSDSPGILINSSAGNAANTISICGNHFHQNDSAVASATAHIRFKTGDGTAADNITLCGNVYLTSGGHSPYPLYVYDVAGVAPTNVSLYETPIPQQLAVLSPAAAIALPQFQVQPATRSFLTGLTLSNDISSPHSAVDIAPGAATDSTGVAVIQNSTGCRVNLGSNGLNGLDTGMETGGTTYFFFIVADEAGSGASTPSCMASAGLVPNFTAYTSYGSGIYRMVGALYTDSSNRVVSFTQDGDTFYLNTPGADVHNVAVGTTAGNISLPSLPQGIAVAALGRCVATSLTSGVYVLVFTPTGTPGTPTAFPAVPGFAIKTAGGLVANGTIVFPYHLYTDTSADIAAQASGASTLNCMTDGWVYHRSQ